MFKRKYKLSQISINLYPSAVRYLNAQWLKEVLAVLQSSSHSAVFSSSVPACLFVFHCVATHKASLVNWLAQQILSCSIIYK